MSEEKTQIADGVASELNAELDTFKTPYDRGLYVGTNQLSKSLCQEKNELDLKAWNYGYKCGEEYFLMKKYPLNDEPHVKMAIMFFGSCPQKHKRILAKKISKRCKDFDINLQSKNIKKYLN